MAEDIYVLIREDDLPTLYRLSYRGIKAYLKRQQFKGKDGSSVVWKGAWSSSTSYSPLDMVSYNGQSYISIKLGTNKDPVSRTDYWDVMAIKGTSGEGINWQGAWDSGTTYEVNDGVSNDGSSYICILESTNNEPPNATYWGVLAQAGSLSFDIHGLTAKTTPVDNDEIPIADSEDSYNNKKILFSKIVPSSRTVNTKALSSNVTLTQDDIGDGSTYKQYSSTEKSKLSGIEASADVTDLTNVSSSINGASAVTPVDADKFPFVDADDNTIKTVTGANLKTYIGAGGSGDITKDELAGATLVTTIADTEHIPISVSGSPNSIKKIVWTAFRTLLDGIYALTGHNHDSAYTAKNTAITAGTNTKITYDVKGLVTSGAAATQDDIGDGSTNKQYSATDKSKLAGIEASADVTDLTNVSSSINGASAVTPVNGDKFPFVDADDNTIKTVSGSDLKTFIGSATLDIHGLTGESALAAADEVPFYDDSAAANRKVTYTNLVSNLGTSFDLKGGSSGQYLKKDGSGDYAFTWGSVDGIPTKTRITDTNSPYSVSSSGDQLLIAVFTSGLTINLPQIASGNDKQIVKIFCNGAGPVVNAYSGQKIRIQGADFDNISPYAWVEIVADNGLGKWLGVYG